MSDRSNQDHQRGQEDLTNAANAIIARNLAAGNDGGPTLWWVVAGLLILLAAMLVVPALNSPETPIAQRAAPATAPASHVERMTRTRTELWPRPEAGGRPIDTLGAGWRVTVLAAGADLTKVEHGGRVGWVVTKALSDLPR